MGAACELTWVGRSGISSERSAALAAAALALALFSALSLSILSITELRDAGAAAGAAAAPGQVNGSWVGGTGCLGSNAAHLEPLYATTKGSKAAKTATEGRLALRGGGGSKEEGGGQEEGAAAAAWLSKQEETYGTDWTWCTEVVTSFEDFEALDPVVDKRQVNSLLSNNLVHVA
mmetsp:Transcript_47412/g.107477  ORF Transcript_47412/g.107477 Transcript_47412/m.107477 type:complete len:175 (-) Transcript_47412:285-809(-)